MELISLQKLPAPLLAWYDANRRVLPWREEVSPYRTWVSEIMLQQTRVQAVLPYFQRFMDAAPDVAALAAMPEQQLMRLWQGLGYYSRARNLKRAAQTVVQDFGGEFPDSYDDLRRLAGIGDYTAGAILSIVFGQAVPAVDATCCGWRRGSPATAATCWRQKYAPRSGRPWPLPCPRTGPGTSTRP